MAGKSLNSTSDCRRRIGRGTLLAGALIVAVLAGMLVLWSREGASLPLTRTRLPPPLGVAAADHSGPIGSPTPVTPCATPAASPTRYAFAGSISTRTAIAWLWDTPTPIVPYEIVKRGQPHFIEFYAWWCSSCVEMLPFVRQLEQQYKDRVDFHILNVDHVANDALVHKYRAYGVPLTVLLDATGRVVKTISGHRDEAALQAAVDWLLALPGCPTVSPPPTVPAAS